jgi:hypothetical protein
MGVALAVSATACTQRSSTAPDPIPIPDRPTGSGLVSGTVVGHLTGTPIAGATVTMGASAAVTTATGEFTLTNTLTSGVGNIIVGAPGYVLRGVSVALAAERTGIRIDMIREADPFSLQFYRAWARDLFGSLEMKTLAPWTVDPNFYFKVSLEDEDQTVPPGVIARIVEIFAASIPELSGGRRQIGTVETGTETRPETDGWVNVIFYRVTPTGALGSTTIGGNTGAMVLFYAPELLSNPQNNPYGCPTVLESVVDHEITHIMGYYHTLDTIIDSFSGAGCNGNGRPERTRFHSAIMYARPPGNRDPDIDPNTVFQAQAPRAGRRSMVACFLQ